MKGYTCVSSRLKLEPFGEGAAVRMSSGRIPVRLYLRILGEDVEDLVEATVIDSWDSISYINRPVEIHNEEGHCITFKQAMSSLLPESFDDETFSTDHHAVAPKKEWDANIDSNENTATTEASETKSSNLVDLKPQLPMRVNQIKLIRVQGIEVDLNIPFLWVVNNLKNPEYFLHICIYMVSSLNIVLEN